MKRVGVLGASGAVGEVMVRLLEERSFPASSVKLLASPRSSGRTIRFAGEAHPIVPVSDKEFEGIDILLSSTPASISRETSPAAARAGAVVIDNSSAWRMDPNVPLVVPEVNPHEIAKNQGIIANPNCSTIQMVVALKPIHDKFRIKRVVVSTYQAVSGAGQKGMSELEAQVNARFAGQPEPPPAKFAHPIAFNCVAQIDEFLDSGYTREEMKLVHETRKIMGEPSIQVQPTCIRVPVVNCHGESILIECEKPITPDEARDLWAHAPGVFVDDNFRNRQHPNPRAADGRDEVFVGRIRQALDNPHGLLFWCVSDNLRKGAALNAVQIAETMIARGL